MGTPATTIAPASQACPAGDTVAYGAVHLDVTDLARAGAFWRDELGLTELAATDGSLHLGTPARELIVLHGGADRPAASGYAGLYHVAIHLPGAAEFARVLARLAQARIPQSPTDHIFSKATYLRDPDGLMLELTLETPERCRSLEITGDDIVLIDSDGRRRRGTEPLDMRAALAPLEGPLGDPVAAGAFIGHVHLHVADLAGSYAFYRDVTGFTEHALMTPIGMADLAAGGAFPHRMALNVWNGPAARQAPAGTAGLRHVELEVASDAELRALAGRAGVTAGDDGSVLLHDPAGNALRVSVAR
jgi:catechol 2,3-dioxygenase